MTVTRTIELNDLNPLELAEVFCEYYGDDQASFFEAVAEITASWPGSGWCSQAYDIAQHSSPRGRAVIQKIADHMFGLDEAAELLRNIEEILTADNSYRLLREACRGVLAKIEGREQ